MADSKDSDKGVFQQVDEHEYYSEPPQDADTNVIIDPNIAGKINHICMKRPIKGKDGPGEMLTMGLINWDVTAGRFFCEYCNCNDIEFEGLWEVWHPGDIATA